MCGGAPAGSSPAGSSASKGSPVTVTVRSPAGTRCFNCSATQVRLLRATACALPWRATRLRHQGGEAEDLNLGLHKSLTKKETHP